VRRDNGGADVRRLRATVLFRVKFPAARTSKGGGTVYYYRGPREIRAGSHIRESVRPLLVAAAAGGCRISRTRFFPADG